ncbi:signal peptidase II [Sphaerisporangium sp. NBC_01403]|uniref:signal peptidase II n=1 Tax=Sphaerisporangium sp. NBC_01403 TaxID=2903599 RepID=UPI0032435A09
MTGEAGERTPARAHGLWLWMVAVGLAVVAADQLSKLWAVSALTDRAPITVIPGLIDFRLLYNPGAAFSIGRDSTWVFAVAAASIVTGILYYGRRLGSPAWALGLGLALGGAASHLLDRLFRDPGFAHGHVVDFIDYKGFFVGNVADIFLVGAAGLLMVLSVRGVQFDGSRETGAADPSSHPGPA